MDWRGVRKCCEDERGGAWNLCGPAAYRGLFTRLPPVATFPAERLIYLLHCITLTRSTSIRYLRCIL